MNCVHIRMFGDAITQFYRLELDDISITVCIHCALDIAEQLANLQEEERDAAYRSPMPRSDAQRP